jgi:hypothetical protein
VNRQSKNKKGERKLILLSFILVTKVLNYSKGSRGPLKKNLQIRAIITNTSKIWIRLPAAHINAPAPHPKSSKRTKSQNKASITNRFLVT